MSLRQKYLERLLAIIPVGAIGVSVLLGSSLPADAALASMGEPAETSNVNVSERLAAIREAAFVAIAPDVGTNATDPDIQLVWGNRWNNFGWGGRRGWGPPRWNNFRPRWNNWRNSWRNW